MDDHLRAVLCHGEWCGLCYEAVRGRRTTHGHLRHRTPRPFRSLPLGSYLSRLPTANGDSGSLAGAGAGQWASRFPALSEFLTATKWADGEPRVPGTLTLFVDGPSWKVCLSDRAQGRVAFVTGGDPEETLGFAETGLIANSLDWRGQRQQSRAKGGKGS